MSLPIAFALTLSLTTQTAVVGLAAPPPGVFAAIAGTTPARVKVEVSGFEEPTVQALTNQAEEAIRGEGIAESTDNEDPIIDVKIVAMGEYGDEGYEITIDATGGGRRLIDAPVRGACELCTESELAERIRKEFGNVRPQVVAFVEERDRQRAAAEAERLRQEEEARRAAAGGTGTPEGPSGPPETGPTDQTPKGMGTPGKVGIGLMAGGGVAVAIGLGLTLNPDKQRSEDIGYELVSTRPPGIATLAVGGAALITGIALFLKDRRDRQSQAAVAPMIGRGVAGVSVAGRF